MKNIHQTQIIILSMFVLEASDLQPARVVFDVSLEGRARKVVTLRSALMIKNKMDLPVEIKLQGLASLHGELIPSDCLPHTVTYNNYSRIFQKLYNPAILTIFFN